MFRAQILEVIQMNETPWSSWEEWRLVRSLLFSETRNPIARRDGCHRVAAWNLRGGKVPLPISATYDLVEAQLLDESRMVTLEQFRLGYAMALVRLVNGAADDGQRGEFAQSVASLAARIGLPKWLVDVRHESTHQTLPSIQVLRLASGQALAWLDDHYWKAQELEISKSQRRNLDEKFALIRAKLEQGEVNREIGPKLPTGIIKRSETTTVTTATTTTPSPSPETPNEEYDEDDEDRGAQVVVTEQTSTTPITAQDIVDSIKHLDATRLAKALFRGMAQNEDNWTKWERVLRWLDGEGSSHNMQVSSKLVMVCVCEAIKQTPSRYALSLLRGLLSRRFHMVIKPSLGKIGTSKSLSIDSQDSWTKKEKTYMDGSAPDVFIPELIAAAKLCFSSPSPQSLVVLRTILIPTLMKDRSSEEREDFNERIEKLFNVHRQMVSHAEKAQDDRARSNHKEDEHDNEDGGKIKFVDWETMERFCREHEQTKDGDDKKESSSTTTTHKKELDSLSSDGMQEWAKVIWPRIPIGGLVRDLKQCPAFVLAPPLVFPENDHALLYHGHERFLDGGKEDQMREDDKSPAATGNKTEELINPLVVVEATDEQLVEEKQVEESDSANNHKRGMVKDLAKDIAKRIKILV